MFLSNIVWNLLFRVIGVSLEWRKTMAWSRVWIGVYKLLL